MMTDKTSFTESAISTISKVYSSLNKRFFCGELPVSETITMLSDSPHLRDIKFSVKNNTCYLEIPISHLTLCPADFCASMLHVMCHQYCSLNGINDTSRGGFYHNSMFRDVARGHGMDVVKHNSLGFYTSPSEELISWCSANVHELPVKLPEVKLPKRRAYIENRYGSHSHKQRCPVCGDIARTTKQNQSVICGDCYLKTKEIVFMRDLFYGEHENNEDYYEEFEEYFYKLTGEKL